MMTKIKESVAPKFIKGLHVDAINVVNNVLCENEATVKRKVPLQAPSRSHSQSDN